MFNFNSKSNSFGRESEIHLKETADKVLKELDDELKK